MKKEIREIENGVMRITTVDERWYSRPVNDKVTGLPTYEFLPSVTWICESYPKGVAFYKYLANKFSWDEAEALKKAAGERGSKVHHATELIEDGAEISIDAKVWSSGTEKEEDLTLEEYEALMSFTTWLDTAKPELLCKEITIFGDGYAGTVDRIYRFQNGDIYIVDLKTSNYIWPSHIIQLSAYSHADINYRKLGIKKAEWDNRKLGILQLGNKRAKAGYKFTNINDQFDLFLHAKAIWAYENPDAKPKQRDYPLSIKSEFRTRKG